MSSFGKLMLGVDYCLFRFLGDQKVWSCSICSVALSIQRAFDAYFMHSAFVASLLRCLRHPLKLNLSEDKFNNNILFCFRV